MSLFTQYVDSVIARVKRGWTQKAPARGATGWQVPSNSNKAVCWCLSGAMHVERQALPYDTGIVFHDALWSLLLAEIGEDSIPQWNDQPGRTVEDVVSLLLTVKDAVRD